MKRNDFIFIFSVAVIVLALANIAIQSAKQACLQGAQQEH